MSVLHRVRAAAAAAAALTVGGLFVSAAQARPATPPPVGITNTNEAVCVTVIGWSVCV